MPGPDRASAIPAVAAASLVQKKEIARANEVLGCADLNSALRAGCRNLRNMCLT